MRQVGPGQVRAASLAALQKGDFQIGAFEIGIVQRGAAQVGVTQVGACQVGAFQIGSRKIGAFKVGVTQVDTGTIGSRLYLAAVDNPRVRARLFIDDQLVSRGGKSHQQTDQQRE